MTRDQYRERLSAGGAEQLWWTWRFLESVLHGWTRGAPKASEEELSFAIDCFLRLAAEDPDWAQEKLGERGPEGHGFSTLLKKERLRSALTRIELPTVKDDAMLKARMLIASGSYKTDKDADDPGLWEDAWAQLCRVPEPERDKAWKEAALNPSGFVAYAEFRVLASEHIASLTEQFWISSFLGFAMPVAARNQDWGTFEEWARAFRALPESLRRDQSYAELLNIEGIRALDEGRVADAEIAMKELVEVAETLQFLSNKSVSCFPRRLRDEGRFRELCAAFEDITKKRDWRLLDRKP